MKVIKTKRADRCHGDRGAVIITNAQYAVVNEDGDVLVAITSERQYMGPTSWRAQQCVEGRPIGYVGYAKSLADIKVKALDLAAKPLPERLPAWAKESRTTTNETMKHAEGPRSR